ncbi:ATP-binding protein [Lacibacter sp. H375]|uniref:PAS domain-containing sensor histidine kinase n=1 Tax=Lacibacter sp. H375 TaxID=3133424 RepID=UPI0030BA7893
MYSSTRHFKNKISVLRYPAPIIITSIYLIVSAGWILWSDTIVMQLARNNSELFTQLQNEKGLAFVLISSALLFVLTNYFCKSVQNSNKTKYSLEQAINAFNVATRGGIIDYEVETKVAHINDKMKFFVADKGTIVPNFLICFLERIHEDDKLRVQTEYETIAASQQTTWTTEYKILGSDNIYYNVMSSVFFVRSETGKLERLIGEIQDISQLRNLQAEHYKQRLNHKKALARTIIKAQENERNRWAQELHDNISQILTVINLYLNNTNVSIDNNVLMINEAKKMITEVQQEIRFLSASIKPPAFTSMTLKQTIERLIQDVNRTKANHFRFTSESLDETTLNDDQKLLIYRIVQEQLNNIIKYANADLVEIDIRSTNNSVTINITDDGNGFDQTKIKTGLGFRNMQSRLAMYNGEMFLTASPGNGCSLVASFRA